MKQQVVEFVQRRQTVSYSDIPNNYTVRKDRRAVWLQRACAWIMTKLGAFARDEIVCVTRHVIFADTFMERLYKQRGEFLMLDSEPKELLIGAEDYQELMASPEITSQFQFRAQYNVRNEDAPYGKVMGLTVRVIPWMRGLLVMP